LVETGLAPSPAAEKFRVEELRFVSGHRFSDAESSKIKRPFRGWTLTVDFAGAAERFRILVLRPAELLRKVRFR
jgi:hypothetical protein